MSHLSDPTAFEKQQIKSLIANDQINHQTVENGRLSHK